MREKHGSIRMIMAFLFFVGAGMSSAFNAAIEAAEKLTMKSIIEGAKKEGKVSWGTNLEEHEVQNLHRAFQKEYPFIKEVSYSRLRGVENAERNIAEMQAGTFAFDMLHMQEELISRYRELGFLMGSIDWKGLFGVDERMIHPNGFGVSVGNNPAGVVYNEKKVPKQRVPKKWSDCYDPFFKGKVSVDVRPTGMLSLWAGYGEEWTLDFAKKLGANEPRWIRGNTQAVLLVAAGEVLLSCPGSHGSWHRQVLKKRSFPVGFVFPEGPIVTGRDLLITPMKGSPHPNAAVLLTGWIATKGVTHLDTGRDSLFHPGTKLGAEFKRMNREIKVESWDQSAKAEQIMTKMLEIWKFPKPSK
jgi:ABC-type Fe3+ transport system substrate-binding protein